MGTLIQIIQFICSISIIVLLHEFGHYIVAKYFKTRVEKFYLFFPLWFSVFKVKRGDTTYGLGWLPLGGFVKIAGMIDESMDKEQLKKAPQPDEFRAKTTWQRLLIIVAGVVVNVLLGIVIYIGILFAWGETYLPTNKAKYGIVCDSLALQIGLQNGDKIITIDNRPVERFNAIPAEIIINNPKTIQVNRNGNYLNIPIPRSFINKYIDQSSRSFKHSSFISLRRKFLPEISHVQKNGLAEKLGLKKGDKIYSINGNRFKYKDEFSTFLRQQRNKEIQLVALRNEKPLHFNTLLGNNGLLGIHTKIDDDFTYTTKTYNFFQAIPAGIRYGYNTLIDYVRSIRLLFTTDSGYRAIGGFGTIGSIFPKIWSWQVFWHLTAFLSIILAFVNILPIPALDGGHAVFILYEMITSRKPSQKVLEYAQVAGFILIILLFILANGNDVIRWIG